MMTSHKLGNFVSSKIVVALASGLLLQACSSSSDDDASDGNVKAIGSKGGDGHIRFIVLPSGIVVGDVP